MEQEDVAKSPMDQEDVAKSPLEQEDIAKSPLEKEDIAKSPKRRTLPKSSLVEMLRVKFTGQMRRWLQTPDEAS